MYSLPHRCERGKYFAIAAVAVFAALMLWSECVYVREGCVLWRLLNKRGAGCGVNYNLTYIKLHIMDAWLSSGHECVYSAGVAFPRLLFSRFCSQPFRPCYGDEEGEFGWNYCSLVQRKRKKSVGKPKENRSRNRIRLVYTQAYSLYYNRELVLSGANYWKLLSDFNLRHEHL